MMAMKPPRPLKRETTCVQGHRTKWCAGFDRRRSHAGVLGAGDVSTTWRHGVYTTSAGKTIIHLVSIAT